MVWKSVKPLAGSKGQVIRISQHGDKDTYTQSTGAPLGNVRTRVGTSSKGNYSRRTQRITGLGQNADTTDRQTTSQATVNSPTRIKQVGKTNRGFRGGSFSSRRGGRSGGGFSRGGKVPNFVRNIWQGSGAASAWNKLADA